MTVVRNHDKVKILVRLYQGIDHLIRARRVNVGVFFSHHQHEFASQVLRQGPARLRFVMGSNRPAHPLLVPPHFVHSVVVTAAVRHGNFVEITLSQNCTQGVLSARRSSINPNPVEIHLGPLLGCGFHPEDSIRESRIDQVLKTDIMKGF